MEPTRITASHDVRSPIAYLLERFERLRTIQNDPNDPNDSNVQNTNRMAICISRASVDVAKILPAVGIRFPASSKIASPSGSLNGISKFARFNRLNTSSRSCTLRRPDSGVFFTICLLYTSDAADERSSV